MTSDEQSTQPLTDAELAEIREDYRGVDEHDSVPRLLAEVDRLRAELSETSSARDYLAGRVEHYIDAHERATQRWENADAEITAQAAKIKRLETERAALVRKLGLDWGPDQFGDLDVVPDIATARELHQPAHSAWHYEHCANGCGTDINGPDPWPCDTARALGMDHE